MPIKIAGTARVEIGQRHRGEAAQEPEGDGGKLVVGIGEHFDQRDGRAQERAHRDAREHQHQHRIAAAHRGADEIDDRDRAEPAGEGQELDPEIDAERKMPSTAPSPAPAATPRMSGDTNGLRNKPWYVAPAPDKRRADQHRGGDARQADAPHHGIDRRRDAARRAGNLGPQHGEEIVRADRKLPDRERHDAQQNENTERQPDIDAPGCVSRGWLQQRLQLCRH